MSTLDRINGEALSVPGLRFWGGRRDWPTGAFRIVAVNDRGAIELWAHGSGRELGGIEGHSPRPEYPGDEPIDDCAVLPGRCYATLGDSLTIGARPVLDMIERGDSAGVLAYLAELHEQEFGTEGR